MIMANKQRGMVVDTRRCMGCHTCAVVCKMENNLPDMTWWNRTLTTSGGSMDAAAGVYPDVSVDYITISCQHCANPACTRVCPVGATYKREEDGVVFQDYNKCIGCRMCIAACPYTGVRSFNWEEPQYAIDFAFGDIEAPIHQKHTVGKCTLCAHRLVRGERPACVDGCSCRARFFGDLDDPNSEVSKLIASREYKQLLPERDTMPSIYYLV
jgi:molybdopterin-containing oxidoreductase family iron-sulfur binding subunit